MPVYEIFIEGKPRKIELTRTGETSFTMKVDNKLVTVELSSYKPDSEKGFSMAVDGKTYQIQLPKIDYEKIFSIEVEEATFNAEVKTPTRKTELATFEQASLTSTKKAMINKQIVEGAIAAPMTGKILSVKVKKGDQVKKGETLCILEAMKMENEITTSKAGTVREVYVSEGSSVSEGDSLFIID